MRHLAQVLVSGMLFSTSSTYQHVPTYTHCHMNVSPDCSKFTSGDCRCPNCRIVAESRRCLERQPGCIRCKCFPPILAVLHVAAAAQRWINYANQGFSRCQFQFHCYQCLFEQVVGCSLSSKLVSAIVRLIVVCTVSIFLNWTQFQIRNRELSTSQDY
jgi:hypothetical protein